MASGSAERERRERERKRERKYTYILEILELLALLDCIALPIALALA